MKSEKYDIDFYPMTHHLNRKQSADEYIEELISFLKNEMIISRRFDKIELEKLFKLVVD